MEARRILLAEDDPEQREFYRGVLEEHGYLVRAVADGAEALEAVESGDPDLAILDVHMPKMDGMQAMGELLKQHRDLKVILFSSYVHPQDHFMSWAADAYVVKSSDLSDLLAAVERLLPGRDS